MSVMPQSKYKENQHVTSSLRFEESSTDVPSPTLTSVLSNHVKAIRLEMWLHQSVVFLKKFQIR